ncbi:MAG: hypothetical protein MOIL_00787 [Candidatus Methanolliviera sp. GoM_oil]|nr:MAG: hypothetical protein MOIL_00787 [Candidatus Methanolliviera sp. GoM_oil]
MRPLTGEEKEKIVEDVEKGKPADQIRREYGISEEGLLKILDDYGIAKITKRKKKVRKGIIWLHNNQTAIRLGRWLADHSDGEFTLDDLIMAIEYDPDDRHDRIKVYNVIAYWREKAKDVWDYLVEAGKIPDGKFAERWKNFLDYYNENYSAFYLLYDSSPKAYFQPDFSEKESLDQIRIRKHAKALKTVLEEMGIFDEELLVTGGSIREAMQATKEFTKKYITDSTYKELEGGQDTKFEK